MIRFLADESCDFAVVRGLRATGYDVVAISETARGAADLAVIAEAVTEERILITEDTDFGQLVYAHAHTSTGVILIRFPARVRGNLVKQVSNRPVSPKSARASMFLASKRGVFFSPVPLLFPVPRAEPQLSYAA